MKKIWYYMISLVMLIGMVGTTHAAEVSTTGNDPLEEITQYEFFVEETEDYCLTKEQPYYIWAGHEHKGKLTQSGIYYDRYTTVSGTDSVYKLNLTIYPSYRYTTSISFCEGGSALFGGKTYNKAGKYEVKLQTQNGCDSIIDLVVKMDGKFVHRDTIRFSNRETQPIKWRGQTITKSGTYYDKYTSQLTGCDSIYELIAIMCPVYEFVKDTAICENDCPYIWRGRQISSSGTYEDPYRTIHGFDSIYRLNLIVNPAYFADYQINICPGEIASFNGVPYRRPGEYQQIHKSINGCDSVWNIFVNYKKTFLHQDSVGINDTASYHWSITDSTYAIPGSYELRYQNQEGCDSIYRLLLYRNPKYLIPTDTAVCVTDSVPYCTWRGRKFYESGVYWDSLYTFLGQDSIYKLNLTIKKPTYATIYKTYCSPQKITFGNLIITESGDYHDTIANVAGCDSIITLVAVFNNNVEDKYDTTVLKKDYPYIWHGDTLYESNYYKKSSEKDDEGCDSTFILHLTAYHNITHSYSDTICASQLEANEPYLYDGLFPMYAKWNDKTREYEDSIYWNKDHTNWFRLHVLKPTYREKRLTFCENEITPQLMHDGSLVSFTKSGTYYDTIPSHENDSRACNDTIIKYIVTINKTQNDTVKKQINIKDLPYIWKGKGKNITITGPGYYTDSAKTAAGCDQVTVWKVSTLTQIEKTICYGDSDLFGGQYVQKEGNYTYTYAHKSGLDSIVQLTLHTRPSSRQEIEVHISDQEDYTWVLLNADGSEHNRVTLPRITGQYTDTVKNSQDCDSIITLKLNVHPTYNLHEDITICESELPYMWEDMQLWEADDYEKIYKTKTWNYDSIRTLTLTVNPIYQTKVTKRLCAGEPLVFNNKLYPQPGFYRDATKTENGCDSVLIIDFQWVYTNTMPQTAECSDQELPYVWKVGDKEIELDHTGVYRETLKSVNPECECDSVVELRLTVYPTYHYEESVAICRSELPYQWHGQLLEETKDYIDKQTTKHGYDSIYMMHFTVLDTAVTRLTYELCHGESVEVNSTTYTEPGIYRDETLRTEDGCDSLLIIDLRWKQTYFTHLDVQCSDQECNESHPYMWKIGNNILPLSHGGTYRDTTKSINGCDSILELTLTVYPTYNFDYSKKVCRDELPYEWHGQLLSVSGDYLDKKTTKQGYDSIYTLHFTVADTAVTRLYFSECPGTSIVVNGHIYNKPGRYEDKSLRTQDGCDSTLIIDFQWKDAYVKYISVDRSDKQVNENTPYEWIVDDHQPKYLTHGGTYRDTLESKITGCDSIIELTLTIHPTYNYVQTLSVCRNELPFEWHGQLLNATGEYIDKQTTKQGYDSIYTIQFTVLEAKETIINKTVCYGESIEVNSQKYYKPGRYEDKSLKTADGCDSILIINLSWYDTYFKQEKASCSIKQLPYKWNVNGSTRDLDHAGTYREEMTSIHGCDSIIELVLTVYPTYEFTENKTVCDSELPFIWHSQQIDGPGNYTAGYYTTLGYDSTYHLNLTVNLSARSDKYLTMCEGETRYENGKPYNKSGLYLDTLRMSNGCDSIVSIHVQVNSVFNDIKTAATSNKQPYTWRGKTLTTAGTYADTLTSTLTGCDSIYTLHLTVYDKEIVRSEQYEICEDELPYLWRGHWCGKDTVCRDTIHTTTTDTIRVMTLKVNHYEHETIERELCEGQDFVFNGRTIKRDTIYHDTIRTGMGCGTDYTIYIRHRKVETRNFYQAIDNKHSYLWEMNGQTYTQSGKYEYMLSTKDGECDSIRYVLNLTVCPTYEFHEKISICQGDVYHWHGQYITAIGNYTDSLKTVRYGYDSVYVLTVENVYPSYHTTQTITLCEGDEPFIYQGKKYDKNCTFSDTLPSSHGCDSVIDYIVRVLPVRRTYLTVDISDQETYTLGNRNIKTSGSYEEHVPSKNGCDSIIYLTLRVHPTYYNEDVIETCSNEPITWRGRTYDKAGVYYDSLHTNYWGYDSIYALRLTVHEHYYIEESVTVKEGMSTNLHGLNITRPGVYMDTLYTKHGCDSIYRITVNMTRTYQQEYFDTICSGETYHLGNRSYSKPGIYRDTIGIDSVVICHLEVLPSYYSEERKVLYPEQFPYLHQGKLYHTEGTYDDTLRASNGCDSIQRLHLVESKHCSNWNYVPLCTGETIYIDSIAITKIGSYSFLRRSRISNMMDSLYLIQVYQASAYDMPEEHYRICKGDTIEWNGRRYWRNGIYDQKLKTTEGCDSIVHLNLIVNPTYHFYTDALIADYESYTWRGNEYNTPGEYDMSYPTQEGCDSTYTLRLKVMETERIYTVDTICKGDTYLWQGKVISQEGTYYDTLYLPGSYTSKIYMLQLHETTPTIIRNARVGEICADADAFVIQFAYDGAKPARYSVQFDQAAQRQGFENIYDAPYHGIVSVQMPVHEKVLYRGYPDYVRPDNYRLRLTVDNGICGVSKSDTLVLQVRYPSWIIEQSWDDVVYPLNKELNGGYEFSHLEWYVNGSKFDTDGRDYIYSNTLREDDKVVLYATRLGENYAIPTCPLTIQKPEIGNTQYPTLLYPNRVSRHLPEVTLEANENGMWYIYSTTGALAGSGHFAEGTQTLTLPCVNNCYLVRMVTESGKINTQKVILF